MGNYDFVRTWDIGKIKELQFKLLKKQIQYVSETSQFYKRKFRKVGLTLSDIRTIKDIEKIPFTTKEDLTKYNDDFICVSNEEIVDYCSTTGTTGKPVMVPLTFKEWRQEIELKKEFFLDVGLKKGDVVQNSMAFDQLFGICIFLDAALKELGIMSLRPGPGNSKRQIELMLRFNTTAIVAFPEYMLVLAKTAKEMGLDPAKDFGLDKGILLAQNLYTKYWKPNALRKKIEEIWNIDIFSFYGSTELCGGFPECQSHGGYHIPSHKVFVEIIDPETQEVLEPGEEGELVFTHLVRESMPLLRYRQGDITYLQTSTCVCGKNTPRMMSIHGRTDQMIKLKGTPFYPDQIEEVVDAISGVSDYIIELFMDPRGYAQLKIIASIVGDQGRIIDQIKNDIKNEIRLTPVIEIRPSEEIGARKYINGTRKPKRFWDRRIKMIEE